MDKPNILFFFTDDQRFDTIRALGNDAIHTPNLDRLVASGTTFTQAHIPGGTCGAVCMPSRAMLHTGRTLFHIEGEGQAIPEEHTTLGEHFRRAGYATFGTGKWHNGPAAYARSFSSGDEIFFGGMEDHWNVPAFHYDPQGKYERRSPFVRDPFYSNQVEYRHCDHVTSGVHSTELFTTAAQRFLARRDLHQPFFMYVSLMAPHDPRTMPERFLKEYDPAVMRLPPNFLAQHPFDTGALRVRDELLAALPREPNEIRRHLAEYYAMITHLDDAFGRLLESLAEAGELANTIIVFAGDNGLALGQHGLMGKQNLYEHSLRVPLIFSGPDVPRGELRGAPVYLFDIFPTLCDLAGLPIPPSVEGRSLVACLEDPACQVRDSLYLAYEGSMRGVKMGGYKLIEYAANGTHTEQLFDLRQDPWEMENLIRRPQHKEALQGLRQELLRLRDAWGDRQSPHGKRFWKARRPGVHELHFPAHYTSREIPEIITRRLRKESGPQVEVHKIWDAAPHNAFTDLIRFANRWWCVFREGESHVSPDGKLRVVESDDGQEWRSAALLADPRGDLRDAKISITPNGQLMLSGAITFHPPLAGEGDRPAITHQSLAWFSDDGRRWSKGLPVAGPNEWLWRVTWHKGRCYGAAYATDERESVRLYTSQDGKNFEPLVDEFFSRRLHGKGYPNETSLVFMPDDTAYCLLRRDADSGSAQLGTARPPYTEWSWIDLGVHLGGPHMLRVPHPDLLLIDRNWRLVQTRLIAAGRRVDGPPRTALFWLDPKAGRLEELLTLPSGGDTSYPGLAWHAGRLWVSYYSSHEGKTSIYLAKVLLA